MKKYSQNIDAVNELKKLKVEEIMAKKFRDPKQTLHQQIRRFLGEHDTDTDKSMVAMCQFIMEACRNTNHLRPEAQLTDHHIGGSNIGIQLLSVVDLPNIGFCEGIWNAVRTWWSNTFWR